MKNLIINAGSASNKYSLFEDGKKILSANYERQLNSSLVDFMRENDHVNWKVLDAIGFRVVHGGDRFYQPTVVTPAVLKQLKELDSFAPLHNPFARQLIEQTQKLFPKVRKILIFDTAFHSTISAEQAIYALPTAMTKKYRLRRYGFHGIAYQSIVHQLKANKKLSQKIIACHLGGGCSIAAIKDGKSIATSMGYTPLEGLIMGTRAGDIDAGLVLQLQILLKKTPKQMLEFLNHEAGLKGLTGTSDMRLLLAGKLFGSETTTLALEMFTNKIAQYIAQYIVLLGGVDRIVFSGGIGENSPHIRQLVCEKLKPLGILIHRGKNLTAKPFQDVQHFFSKAKITFLHVDEAEEVNRELLTL